MVAQLTPLSPIYPIIWTLLLCNRYGYVTSNSQLIFFLFLYTGHTYKLVSISLSGRTSSKHWQESVVGLRLGPVSSAIHVVFGRAHHREWRCSFAEFYPSLRTSTQVVMLWEQHVRSGLCPLYQSTEGPSSHYSGAGHRGLMSRRMIMGLLALY